ncbi:MAG: VanZ family protein [Blastocatellia bacterium]|nr:VanZ family protein [Blastocatellia bacterium]
MLYWLPPILWMSAMFFFSTDIFSAEETGSVLRSLIHSLLPFLGEEGFQSLHFLIRKSAHFTEYGILSLLLYRAFRNRSALGWQRRWASYSLLIVVISALADEYHQSFTRLRTPSIDDSLLDIAGGFTALFLLWVVRRKAKSDKSTY